MPKVKAKLKKAPRRSNKSKQSNSLGLYVIIGVIAAGLIYWFSKLPDVIPMEETQVTETETKAKPRIKSAAREVTKDSVPEVTQEVDDLDSVIIAVIQKLGVPEKGYRKRKRDTQITYQVSIDRSNMDLTYANMIFKGEIEKNKGRLVKGSEQGGRQILSFAKGKSELTYVVELFYDSKLYSAKSQNKVISIIIDDFGDISGQLLADFFELDTNVCFAIFPDAPQSISTMQKAAAQGRETLIHVPMEPLNYPAVNPGKNAILVTMSEQEIERRMTKFISDMHLCKGANNHMGSLATSDESIMQPVMNALKKHGLYFVDSRTSNVSVAYQVAQKTHIPAFRNDIFLDSPNLSNDNFNDKLAQVIEMGSKKNHVIAITHCHTREHLVYLKRFIQKLKENGFTIVPVSNIGQHDVPTIL